MKNKTENNYWNPYLGGAGLGFVLLASFIFLEKGIGVSGGLTSLTEYVNQLISGGSTENSIFSSYLQGFDNFLNIDPFIVLIIGIAAGGAVSGLFAGRSRFETIKGEGVSVPKRLLLALLGGTLMGFAAKIGRGCTSGQALSGGALLNLGSWIYMLSIFAGGYASAYFLKRFWK